MKIAIIGTGITGNTAAWLLHQNFDVHVYEAADYVGGHAHTANLQDISPVDTGFIVYNEWTYPNLIALFDHLRVRTQPTDMSFGVSLNGGAVEYSGDHLLAQPENMLRPRFYCMVADILRFYKTAPLVLEDPLQITLSLGEYLSANRYSKAFIDWHILPMAAAIWSTSADDIRRFPIQSFVQFFVNHGLFLLKDRPQWHTVTDGSQEYVSKLTASFRHKIRLNTAVKSVFRDADKVIVRDASGGEERFDHVILACHSDQALAILSDANPREHDVLSAFPYAQNTAYLHRDEALMPRRKKAWSSWNYLASTDDGKVCLSYWMNRLQPFIGHDSNMFVTLNPATPPAPEKTLKTMTYAHPQYTLEALNGWDKIKRIQGKNRIWFCGAWCGYGFHEDGISAGLAVAETLSEHLGKPLKRPWKIQEKSPAGRHATPE